MCIYHLIGAVNVTISSERPVLHVCLQNSVTFTCTVDSGETLVWIAEPFITDDQRQVIFLPSDIDINPTRTIAFSGVTFHAVLTQSDPLPGSDELYILQSTLTTIASNTTNGTVIACQDVFSRESDSVTLELSGQLHSY